MKFVKIAGVSIIVIFALAVLGVSLAFAQQPGPNNPPWWDSMQKMMQGRGMMGGDWESMRQMHDQMQQYGGMGAMHAWMYQSGGMHNLVWKALAEKLGLTPEELSAEINNGKALAQVAEEKGVSAKDLAAVMETAMKAGLAQAVKDGALTQEQADFMLEHMAGRYEWMITNMGAGMMGPGRGGRMGPGAGGCHDYNQPPSDSTSF